MFTVAGLYCIYKKKHSKWHAANLRLEFSARLQQENQKRQKLRAINVFANLFRIFNSTILHCFRLDISILVRSSLHNTCLQFSWENEKLVVWSTNSTWIEASKTHIPNWNPSQGVDSTTRNKFALKNRKIMHSADLHSSNTSREDDESTKKKLPQISSLALRAPRSSTKSFSKIFFPCNTAKPASHTFNERWINESEYSWIWMKRK